MLCHTAYPRSRRLCLGGFMKYQAIALCRVSTIGQLRDGNLEPQEERIIKAAEFLEVDIVEWWKLAISSRKGKNAYRKDLLEMYEFCKRHKTVKFLIVDEVDRFMRAIDDYYFWKVQFRNIGVQLRHANKPQVDPEDPRSVFDELIDVYRAEQSNDERISKTPEKMQAKMRLGYYPGVVHHGYKKTDVPSLHEPLEPQWGLLRASGRKILYEAYTLHEALAWLNNNGYEYSGRKMAMDKFKHVMKDPYNGGIITMRNWEVVIENGLHKAMFTKEEHERLEQIVIGKGKKFTVRKDNPLFGMSNVGMCPECFTEHGSRAALVGFTHNNGKQGNSRKYYDRYRCRVCNKAILKKEVHEGVDEFLESVEYIEPKIDKLKQDLKKAWREEMNDNTQVVARLKRRLNILKDQKNGLISTLAVQPDLVDDIKTAIIKLKQDINIVENDIIVAEDTDIDFEEFVDFSISFVDNMKSEFWDLERVDKQRCKQLLFPGEILVSRTGKVSTRELSKLIRYKNTPTYELVGAKFMNGGPK
jgi:DNA invertase Pin-like site-specific DNA recombinase